MQTIRAPTDKEGYTLDLKFAERQYICINLPIPTVWMDHTAVTFFFGISINYIPHQNKKQEKNNEILDKA